MDLFAATLALAIAQQTTAQPEAPEQPQERRICRRVNSSTSRMDARRICKTAAEWAATARNPSEDTSLSDGLDPRAHMPQTGCTGGLGGGPE